MTEIVSQEKERELINGPAPLEDQIENWKETAAMYARNADYHASLRLPVLQKKVYDIAHEKGWHDTPATIGDRIALMHSELSEALEEYRKGHMELYFEGQKPEGFGIELADVVIRILHLCEIAKINLEDMILKKMAYNETREYRHGGKAI